VLGRVRQSVRDATQGSQVPWTSGSVSDDAPSLLPPCFRSAVQVVVAGDGGDGGNRGGGGDGGGGEGGGEAVVPSEPLGMRHRRGWGAQADGAPGVDVTQRSDHQPMSRFLLGDTQAARGPWWRMLTKRSWRRLAEMLVWCVAMCLAGAYFLGVLPWLVDDRRDFADGMILFPRLPCQLVSALCVRCESLNFQLPHSCGHGRVCWLAVDAVRERRRV
jgi:hypothetical protein